MTSVAVLYSGGADESSELLFSYMAVQPTAARKVVLNTFVTTLKSAGVWQKLDLLYVLAAHDAQAGRLNWIAPQTFPLVQSGTVTFTTDQGFTGNATDGRLDVSGTWTPGQMTQNSAIAGCYVRTAASYNGSTTYYSLYTGSGRILRRPATEANIEWRINDGTTGTTGVAGQTGHFAVRRTTSSERSLWREGSQVTTATATSTANGNVFRLFNANGAGFGDPQLSLAYAGAQIDDTAMAAFNTAIGALKTGIGF